jgi:hypothetical protein
MAKLFVFGGDNNYCGLPRLLFLPPGDKIGTQAGDYNSISTSLSQFVFTLTFLGMAITFSG